MWESPLTWHVHLHLYTNTFAYTWDYDIVIHLLIVCSINFANEYVPLEHCVLHVHVYMWGWCIINSFHIITCTLSYYMSGMCVITISCISDARFVTTFLLGYRHFATTLEFLTKLLERYPLSYDNIVYVLIYVHYNTMVR